MKINGYDVLCNEAQAKRWLKKHCIWPDHLPTEYPCIAESRISSDENGYADFIYMATVTEMQQALWRAERKQVSPLGTSALSK